MIVGVYKAQNLVRSETAVLSAQHAHWHYTHTDTIDTHRHQHGVLILTDYTKLDLHNRLNAERKAWQVLTEKAGLSGSVSKAADLKHAGIRQCRRNLSLTCRTDFNYFKPSQLVPRHD